MADLPLKKCLSCGNELAPDALACQQCHALVHSEELAVLSNRAQQFETNEDFASAKEIWTKALTLLPHESTQAEWVRTHLYRLELSTKNAPPPKQKHKWAKWLGPVAPIAIFLAKAKWLFALFKAKFLFSFVAFLWVDFALFGWKFGLGFAVMILIHEMGHYIDIRRRGLRAEMPVFLPGLGAYVQWNAMGVSLRTRAAVSLAGPLAGGLACAGFAILWRETGNDLWGALARAGALLNLLNLIPVWVLDGAGASEAMNKTDRCVILGFCVALAILFWEGSYLLVAGGVGYQLTKKEFPAVPGRATLAYFAVVLVLLGAVLRFVPGHGFIFSRG
ncbi:MAG: site-2 protease family protein [Acidobacteria bacterium]|nr:site-2 protease family protein [Acidobacteriota bacterium]MBS1864336.1 site-2 protease family protein [Acidobacteriota bacterium]